MAGFLSRLFGRNGSSGPDMARRANTYPEELRGPSGRVMDLDYDDPKLFQEEDSPFALPHVMTYAGIIGTAYRTYIQDRWDESLKHDREDALVMRRDGWLMALLRERIDEVVRRKWHIKVEDDKDPEQTAYADVVTKAIKRTPYLRKYIRSLGQSIWYGRYANQAVWADTVIDGLPVKYIRRWIPTNGDKLAFLFDGTPAVAVYGGTQEKDFGPDAEFTYTTIGRALILKGAWRMRFCLAKHEIDDGDYFDPESAPSIHGVGVRHRVFWLDWMRREFMGWTVNYMERVGQGITIWFYDDGNPQAKTEAETAARLQSNRMNIVWPRGRGANSGSGVERIETPVAGTQLLIAMQQTMEEKIERYIVGQKMSASHTGSGGLGGSGAAEFQMDTKKNIGDDDASSIGEALTGSEDDPGLVSIVKQSIGLPADYPMQLVFEEDPVDPVQQLDAVVAAYGMGVDFIRDEVRALTGLSKPAEDDDVISMAEQMLEQGEMQMGLEQEQASEQEELQKREHGRELELARARHPESADEAVLRRAGQ